MSTDTKIKDPSEILYKICKTKYKIQNLLKVPKIIKKIQIVKLGKRNEEIPQPVWLKV